MKELIYEYMDPKSTLEQIQEACKKTLSEKYAGLCVPQWFVSTAKQALNGAAKVVTIVGLPGGTTSSFAKYAEVKQAVANGADSVLVTVNMDMCANSDFAAAKNDLIASMAPAKKHNCAAAILDAAALTKEQLVEAGKFCMDAGAKTVYVTNACDKCMEALLAAGIEAGTFGLHTVASARICVTPAG